jgi:hypothetical protein
MLLFMLVGGYLVVGLVFAGVGIRRQLPVVQVVMLVPLWPLLGPSTLLEHANPGAVVSGRERAVIERFREHVAARTRQLEALDRLKARGTSSERLRQLEEQLARDLDAAKQLLDELQDRIALAHVASLGPTSGDSFDRQNVEALLARADALVQETTSDLGSASP